MNKLIKKIALMVPPIKKYHQYVNDLRRENEELNNLSKQQSIQLELSDQTSVGRLTDLNIKNYQLEQLSNLFEDNVELSWSEINERKKYICIFPFSRVSISSNGSVWTCCPNYFKYDYFLGNVYENSYDEIWNSDKVKRLRYSVSNGSFEYCNKKFCSLLQKPAAFPDSMIKREWENVSSIPKHDKWQDYYLETGPLFINLACDNTCNLHCSSCRNHVVVMSKEQNKRLVEMLETFVRPALKNCLTLKASTSGEFFAQKSLQEFYQTIKKEDYPELKLNFLTNAQLLTPEKWNKFDNLKGMINSIHVSIDAATKDTYENIRRGGKWETLLTNLSFISSLRVSNEIKNLNISFNVQKDNFTEMENFVLMASQYNVDTVLFRRLYNPGGTYTAESLIDNDVFNKNNNNYENAVHILNKIKKNSCIKISDNCLFPNQYDDI